MTIYDLFLRRQHPPFVQGLMRWLNKSLLKVILKELHTSDNTPISLLEIGPGKGYFFHACREVGGVEYWAMDRNPSMLLALADLPEERKIEAEAPQIPALPCMFHVIYAGFVAEHFEKGGKDIYGFIRRCKQMLLPGGLIVMQVPDAEKLGMEFWNTDYTHTFPTTKRSVAHAFYDNGISDLEIVPVNGLLTHPLLKSRFICVLSRLLLLPYQYRILDSISYYLWKRQSYRFGSLSFSIYALLKQQNLLIIARTPSVIAPS